MKAFVDAAASDIARLEALRLTVAPLRPGPLRCPSLAMKSRIEARCSSLGPLEFDGGTYRPSGSSTCKGDGGGLIAALVIAKANTGRPGSLGRSGACTRTRPDSRRFRAPGLCDMARAERTGRFDCQDTADSCARVGWPRGVPRAADDPSRRPVCRCRSDGPFVHKLAARTESAGAFFRARLELGAFGSVLSQFTCPDHERSSVPVGIEVVRGRHRVALPGHGSIEMPPTPPCHGGLRGDVDGHHADADRPGRTASRACAGACVLR